MSAPRREPCPCCGGEGEIVVFCPVCENTGVVKAEFGGIVIATAPCPNGCADA